MALIKSKVGNTTYSWKSDDIRDAEINAITNVYGAKNLLPKGRSGQINGVIFTDNADGSITITGNPTEYTPFTIYNNLNLASGQYILSGIPSGGGANKWGINCEVDGSWLPNSVWQGGATSYSINVSSIINQVTLIVYPKTDGDYNLTFYPMIRDARITDPTYVPYAMTNRELMDDMASLLNKEISSPWMMQNSTWHSGIKRFCNCLVALQGYDSYSYGLIFTQKFGNGDSFAEKISGADHFNVEFIDGELCCKTDGYSQGYFIIFNLLRG